MIVDILNMDVVAEGIIADPEVGQRIENFIRGKLGEKGFKEYRTKATSPIYVSIH